MARSETPEVRLEALQKHRFGDDAKADSDALAAALSDPHYRVVAKAAELAAERLCYPLVRNLIDAYQRLLSDPVKKDPQCYAKQAIARALVALECNDTQFFIAGLSYRQMEPVWGGTQDTAVDVRSSCAMGLVNSGYPRAIQELTALLNDPEIRARQGAARAIACGEPRAAEALLRFKILVGDDEPEVLGDCFTALLAVAGEQAVPLVENYISYDGAATSELAALALGESRLPLALKGLREVWENTPLPDDLRRAMLRAIALHRSDAAFDLLLTLVADGSSSSAEAALEALGTYKHNARLGERIRATVTARNDRRVTESFERVWASGPET
jgi:HEAT repeat protein